MRYKRRLFRPASPRGLVVHLLDRIEREGAFAESLLDVYLTTNLQNDEKNRRLVTQVLFGTLRMRGYLDWIISCFYRGSFAAMDDGLKNILRAALYQMFFLDRIPSYAAVNEAVAMTEARFRGRGGLVNAILRHAIRGKDAMDLPDRDRDLPLYVSVVHAHPKWLVETWLKRFGEEETIRLCAAGNTTPPVTVRVNTLKTSRREVLEEMQASGIDAVAAGYSPDGVRIIHSSLPARYTPWFKEGKIQFQDEGSQLISRFLDPKPSENILDLCSGTGGKTTHLAALMGGAGRIVALDNRQGKLDALRDMARRMGVSCIETLCRDGRGHPPEGMAGHFDRVLVDAPCSGLGTLRRNPEIKWRLVPGDIAPLADLQFGLLEGAARYLKKGGCLVYSTCSLLPEENEDNVRAFLARHPEFRLDLPPITIHSDCLDRDGCLRTLPHLHDMDGFFAARLVRTMA
ncbi:MAG: 16S rRNA (cytosine(967)-C(5))-methyltransferase RsmB [Deltaproteobacteria bacterium]|nr:16S rRNA (cytosine(967)-C(5))-methyltransferase RsmB [Deltaproteobacteria bacterium]